MDGIIERLFVLASRVWRRSLVAMICCPKKRLCLICDDYRPSRWCRGGILQLVASRACSYRRQRAEMLATEVHRWFLSGCNGAWRRPRGHGQGAVWAKVVDGSAEIQIQGAASSTTRVRSWMERRPWASLSRSCSRGYLKWLAGSTGFASVMAER